MRKISFWNIIFSLIFIFTFFIGTVVNLPEKPGVVVALGANAILQSEKPQKKRSPFDTIAFVIPVKKAERTVNTDNKPQGNYTTDIPVLSSDGDLGIRNDIGENIDIKALLDTKTEVKEGKVQVLILHTHTSEAYTKTAETEYEESDAYRTQNGERNIIAVGEVMAEELESRGIGVIHDKTYHDYPAYSGAYKRALGTIAKNINENPGITLVIDVHRDALQNKDGSYMKTMAEINGEKCAQALIVIGTDKGGLEHKNWRENLKWGLKLQNIMTKKYPGLPRALHLCNERYNGHTSTGAMIIEIGSNGNTLPEAEKTAKLVGECIADLIQNPENR